MEGINKVGNFTISLINDSTIKVKKARSNHVNTDFTKDLILIDNLGAAQLVGVSDDFDGLNEVTSYATFYKQTFTYDFYGTNAHDLALKFIALLRSQKSYDLQQTSGLTFYRPTTLNDLKQLVGTTNNNRFQLEITVRYSHVTELATLRIDSLNLDEILYDRPKNIVDQFPSKIEYLKYLISLSENYNISTDGNFLVSKA